MMPSAKMLGYKPPVRKNPYQNDEERQAALKRKLAMSKTTKTELLNQEPDEVKQRKKVGY